MQTLENTGLRALAVLAITAGVCAPARAADPEPKLEEIVVSATKRNENLLDVPIPISAVSGDALQAANANGLADYITRMPGVAFNDYQPGISEVVIRGVAATTYHEQGQTTVGYYLNEVVLVEPGFPIGIPDIDTFDLDRVEVLRGPQGTLFGASTLGGLVSYVAKTADPRSFSSAAQVLAGSGRNLHGDMNYAVKGMVNVPIVTDKVAVRVTALQRFDAGFLDNPGTGVDGSNDFRTRGARGSLVFTPGDNTTITFMSAYQDTQLDDQTYLTLGTYIRDTPRAEPQKTDFWLNSLRLDQKLGFATLTVIGSYDDKNNTTVFSYPYAYVTGLTTGADAAYSIGNADAHIKTAEARLASTGEGPLRWLIGTSYMRADKFSHDRIYQAGAAAYIDAHPGDFGSVSGAVLAPNDAIYGYISDTLNDDFGVFGEVSYRFTSQLELTVGGRYYDTKNTATITNAAGSLGAGSFSATDQTFGTSQKEDGFTPKVTLAYRPTDLAMIYATYSEGFRIGGPNPNAAILPGIPKSYDSDTVENYELGTKLALLDRRLMLDATVFHLDWKDIQARLFTDAPYFYSYVTNAGSAKIDGAEFTGAIQITPVLGFSTNVTYQDARLSTFLPDTFAVGGGYPEGSTLPGSSKWSIADNIKLDFPGAHGGPSFELAHRFLSSAPVAFGNPAERGNFHVFDLRASFGIGDNYRVLAFVNNVFDKYGVLNAPFTSQLVPAGSIIRPRMYGVRLDWQL
jgi:outer membrane receptor protein involved in Fe transport